LGSRRGIHQSGKYLSGKAYRFYEQNILQNGKKYTLTEYFAALFDYIFLANFHMQQRDEFDSYRQEDLSAVDYLCQLQDLADTVGDLDDADIVLAFWRHCQSYIRSELTCAGYEPSILTVNDLETLKSCIERTEEASHETQRSPSQDGEADSEVQPGDAELSESETSSDGFNHSQNSPEEPENEHQRIKRLCKEGKCFLCKSSEHLARNCSRRRNNGLSTQLNSIRMSATEIKLAALTEGRNMGLFVIENEAHLMEGLQVLGEDSEMSSAGHGMLEYFDDLQSEVEGDPNTGDNNSPDSESNYDEFANSPDLEPATDSEDERNDSDWYSYWDLPSSYHRRNPDEDDNSPGSLTVCSDGPGEDSEGKSVQSGGSIVLKAGILSEQLEGKDIPNFIEIFKNQRVNDVTNDTPFDHAIERGLKGLFDLIALSVVAYPDMTLFQTGANGLVNGLDTEVPSAVTTNDGLVRTDNSKKATMLNIELERMTRDLDTGDIPAGP
jgi:hypothetical protein